MSLTLHKHGKSARLGVMADAIIGPQHAAIARGFPVSLDKLARTLGAPRIHDPDTRSPSPDAPVIE